MEDCGVGEVRFGLKSGKIRGGYTILELVFAFIFLSLLLYFAGMAYSSSQSSNDNSNARTVLLAVVAELRAGTLQSGGVYSPEMLDEFIENGFPGSNLVSGASSSVGSVSIAASLDGGTVYLASPGREGVCFAVIDDGFNLYWGVDQENSTCSASAVEANELLITSRDERNPSAVSL